VITQTILSRTVIHVRDFESDPDVSSASREMSLAAGHRSLIAVPMLREGAPISAIAVGRRGPKPVDFPKLPDKIRALLPKAAQA
jgi:hypothetical protein